MLVERGAARRPAILLASDEQPPLDNGGMGTWAEAPVDLDVAVFVSRAARGTP